MSVALTDNQTLLAFKAGRSFRRAGTNFVDADPTKGAVVLSNNDDGLLHFMWKERATGGLGEDLILFPGDATFNKVAQAPGGRTYVLRFESSDQRHFDASTRRDDEFVHNLNRLLADPNIIPVWDSRLVESQESTSTPGASTSQTPDVPYVALLSLTSSRNLTPFLYRSSNTPASLPPGTTPEQLARLRALVTSMGASAGPNPDDEVSLTDILTPSNLLPLFTSHPTLLSSLFPHLPPDLLPSGDAPLTPNQTTQLTENLQRTINSPPFRVAVAQLDRALRTGALGGFVRSLGLPESAGTGVEAFLRAIGEQARREGREGSGQEDMMEED
ncbi:adhesion regulating molecule [Lanmaoa asiatica]|nr:adhesion regulating molecule [Lanmaoa asiatica]